MHKLIDWINTNHWVLLGFVFCAGLIFWIYGCQSETKSLVDPERQVSRDELQLELNNYIGLAKIRFADLDRQDELKAVLLDNAALFAQTGTVNPYGILTTLVSVAAVGFGLDRNRKLKDLKSNVTAPSTNSPKTP